MKAIIIAAGQSKRLRPLTEELPKCMLEVNGKPIIENTIELFRQNNIDDISIIVGYKKEKIKIDKAAYYENTDYSNNNILFSLMFAREKLEEAVKTKEEVVITYSDIWYENDALKALLASKDDISAVVDTHWHEYYNGRTDHLPEEAENVIMDADGVFLKIGKHIITSHIPNTEEGEFLGLWKFMPRGAEIFLNNFDAARSALKNTDPFQRAREFQKACITDIFQEIIDKGGKIRGVLIKGGWKEFDTIQDYMRIKGGQNNSPCSL